MKKLIYIIAISIFFFGIFGCGEARVVVVGGDEVNSQYSDNEQEVQNVNEYPILESKPAPNLKKNNNVLKETFTK